MNPDIKSWFWLRVELPDNVPPLSDIDSPVDLRSTDAELDCCNIEPELDFESLDSLVPCVVPSLREVLVAEGAPGWLLLAGVEDKPGLPINCHCEEGLELEEGNSKSRDVEDSTDVALYEASLDDISRLDWTKEVLLPAVIIAWL